jgi:insertion element IS1 protein InsB
MNLLVSQTNKTFGYKALCGLKPTRICITMGIWILKAVDRGTGRTIAWVTGRRDAATFSRLYDKVKHLTECLFYTDDWEAFSKVLPKEPHIIGKSGTVSIEGDNSNTRHHLGPMTRRTKGVSKKESMVYGSIKLWCALTTPDTFLFYQNISLSIFM